MWPLFTTFNIIRRPIFSRRGVLIWQIKYIFGKVSAVWFSRLLLRQLWLAIFHMNKSVRLHKHHCYNKNAVSSTWVVDSECHKGRRSVVIHVGGKLQSSVTCWGPKGSNSQLWYSSFVCCTHINATTTRSMQKWTHIIHFQAHLLGWRPSSVWTFLYLIKIGIRRCDFRAVSWYWWSEMIH